MRVLSATKLCGHKSNRLDIDVKDAQDAITSIIKAFDDVDASNIESVMDKLITTGKMLPGNAVMYCEE